MTGPYRITSALTAFSPCADRLMPAGYREPMSLEERLEAASRVEGLAGVNLEWPFGPGDPPDPRPFLSRHGLELSTLELALFRDRIFKLGTLTAPDPGVRREAIARFQRGLEISAELGARDVLLWPGPDGFDYPFQCDYARSWRLLIDGIGEVAAHRPQVRIAIEYKKAEPRASIHVRNAGVLLWLLGEAGLPNVGATIDLGHSFVAGENPAEAVTLLARAGKLFQVHIDDNYRDWDHDLLVGSVNFWETLEFFYWVERSGYEGAYLLDIYPYREDGSQALQEGVDRTRWFLDQARELARGPLAQKLERSDALAAQREVWRQVLAGRPVSLPRDHSSPR